MMEKEILIQLIELAGSQSELSKKSKTPMPRISEWMKDVYVPKLSRLIEIADKAGFKIEFTIVKKADK